MEKTKCNNCNKTLYRSPSKVQPRNYCSRICYARVRDREFAERGENTRFNTGHKNSEEWRKIMSDKMSNEKHPMWKGNKVGYRGLHYWLERKLGRPSVCIQCKKVDIRPRFIQWANTDGRYRRVLTDYVALCGSCHKLFDLKRLKKSTLGV